MRRADHLLKTMTAVQGCIADCRKSAAPLSALETHLHKLRLNPDWTEEEIAEVERCARRALEHCSAPPTAMSDRSSAMLTSTTD